MRFHSITAVAATVAYLQRPSGVSGFATADVNDPTPALDNHTAVVDKMSLRASDAINGEERTLKDVMVELVRAVGRRTDLNRLPSWSMIFLQHWWDHGRSIDDLARSLKLSIDTRETVDYFKTGDFRKMEVLEFYISFVNVKKGGKHKLIETLTKNFGDLHLSTLLMNSIRSRNPDTAGRAAQLQQEMMTGWAKRKLTGENVCAMMELEKKGIDFFTSTELLTLERYVEHLQLERVLYKADFVRLRDGTEMSQDDFELLQNQIVLNILTEAFGGEEEFAMLASAKLIKSHHPMVGKYLDTLLLRWKMAQIEPDHLLKTKFLVMHPTEGQSRTVAFIRRRYRGYFYRDIYSLPIIVRTQMRHRGIS
uniref:RxLR effector candidate protein n=1 Tax=Peronospora matthiolae TaxID=2874970 RepID=A0AAV1UEC5_9STRA